MKRPDSAVLVFGVHPRKIGSAEAFAREIAVQLKRCDWRCVVCFLEHPPDHVRDFFQIPGVTIELVNDCHRLAWQPIKRLARILREHRPRVLHLNFTGMLSFYPWLAKLLGVERVLFTDQSSRAVGYVPSRATAFQRALSRLVNQPISAMIAVSGFGYRCLTALDIFSHDRITLIYNAVDIDRAALGCQSAGRFRRRYSIPADSLLVVQVSWMIPEKGIDDFLEAAKRVADVEPKAHFLLAGDGSYQSQFQDKAWALGLCDRVTFTGLMEDPLAEGLFAAADVVCQVSRWEEVFGWVIAEAMASGKPVVATRVGGIPELVEHRTTGFLVDRGDVLAISNRILELLRDPALGKRMGEAGLRAARLKFNLQVNVSQLLKLYGIPRIPVCRNAPGRFGSRVDCIIG
jgi:glycosyltransferase involved in cell wall biosynthesis